MLRISVLKTALRTAFFLLILSMSHLSFGQQNLTFNIHNTQIGDTVIAEFRAFDFTNILTMQFTLEWDETEMEFVSVQDFNLPGLQIGSFGYVFVGEGKLTFSWLDPDVAGITIPDCISLFTMKFASINGNATPVTIITNPTIDEITDGDQNFLPWAQSPLGCGTIQGSVLKDLDGNCFADAGETPLENWKVQFENGTNTFYSSTNHDGDYSLNLIPGDYTVSLILPNANIWATCLAQQVITVDSSTTSVTHFPVEPIVDCPLMSVDLSTPFLRRCFTNKYYVNYCNLGTVTAEDAYVEVEFDSFLLIENSSIPWSSVDGQTYTFDLGDVTSGDCESFWVELELSCDAALGQTHCAKAHIFPDDPCIPSINWDGSNLDITGTCDGDSVRFQIINNGDDMAEPVEFIVIEDDMIHLTSDPIQLLEQETLNLAVEANGSTWRVEMPETPDNPFGTFATDAIEGCGTNNSGEFSLGFVTQFPLDDESLAIDEDCQENLGAYDPNDKTGYPKGFCQANYIRADQEIEYRIRFQNTGTDTAFNITITDTLSQFLSPASVRPGSSSHPFEYSLLGEGVVKFTFSNIMLPDSNVNEPASHGFVKFSIKQQTNNPMGTVIENQADIFFDFNDPIRTNTVRHTIGDDFVEMQGVVGDLSVAGNVSTWWGDPLYSVAMTMTNLCPVFTDADGNFEFVDIDTANYALNAFKEVDNPRRGITILDLVKMRNFILGLPGWEFNGFQQIAADVNNSNTITSFDLVTLSKSILGFEDNNLLESWRFVTSDSDTTASPLQWNSTYDYVPLDSDQMGQDFIGIQPGNIIDESMVELSPIATEFRLQATNVANGQIRVDVTAKEYLSVVGFQFGLTWDKDVMNFEAISSGAITGINEFNVRLDPTGNQLYLYYFTGTTDLDTYDENETLFTLVFNALAPIGSTTTLELDESDIPLQVVVDTCKLANPAVISTEVEIQEPNAVIDFADTGLQVKIAPNPILQGQTIRLEIISEHSQELDIQLFDLSGAATGNMTLNAAAGRSFHSVKQPMSKGIYLMKVRNAEGEEMTGKVVVF